MRTWLVSHFPILVAVCLAAVGNPAVVPKLTMEELAASAESIVHGRLVDSRVAWDPSHRYIWTHYTLQVQDVLKGSPARTMVVSEPGGALDGLTMQTSGSVPFSPREEVLLFLHKTPVGYWRVQGLGQGKYTVLESKTTGAKSVRVSLHGLVLAEPSGTGAGRRLSAAEQSDGIALEEFKRRIREILSLERRR